MSKAKKILTGFVAVAILSSYLFFAAPPKAEALFGLGDIVLDPSNLVENTVSAVQTIQETLKDFVLNAIVWNLINSMIEEITQDTVKWINSGFNGSPAFVTNPDQMLQDASDQVTGAFLTNFGLAGVCGNFAPQVKLALRVQPTFQQRYQCTLSRAISNVDAFMNDFTNGGWAGWIAITEPNNNPYGVFLNASQEMAARQAQAQQNATMEANWGQGFLSYKDSNGNITTPGKAIEDRLNSALGEDFGRLNAAHQINELLSALMTHFITSWIHGESGISGGGTSGTGGVSGTDINDLKTNAKNAVDAYLSSEKGYLSDKQTSLDTIGQILTELNNYKNCATHPADIDNSIAGFTQEQKDIQNDIDTSNALIAEGNDYKTKIDGVSTYDQLQQVMDDLSNVFQPKLHTDSDISDAADEKMALGTDLTNITSDYNTNCGAH